MWPFDIFAKRREREAHQRREEGARHLQRIADSIGASKRLREQFQANPTKPNTTRQAAAQRPATLRVVPPVTQNSTYDDLLSPINPLSPIHQISQFSTWSVPDEPRHSSSRHCDTLSSHASHSSSDYSSSHSSHDHSCSSSSYDSGSSSSSSDY